MLRVEDARIPPQNVSAVYPTVYEDPYCLLNWIWYQLHVTTPRG